MFGVVRVLTRRLPATIATVIAALLASGTWTRGQPAPPRVPPPPHIPPPPHVAPPSQNQPGPGAGSPRERRLPASRPTTAPSHVDSAANHCAFDLPPDWINDRVTAAETLAQVAPRRDRFGAVLIVLVKAGDHPLEPELLGVVMDAFVKEFKTRHPTVEFDPPQETTVGGRPAKAIVFHGKVAGVDERAKYVFTINFGQSYVLSLLTPERKFETYLPEFDRVVQSFRFTQDAATRPSGR
jgi:hypothetical protein